MTIDLRRRDIANNCVIKLSVIRMNDDRRLMIDFAIATNNALKRFLGHGPMKKNTQIACPVVLLNKRINSYPSICISIQHLQYLTGLNNSAESAKNNSKTVTPWMLNERRDLYMGVINEVIDAL